MDNISSPKLTSINGGQSEIRQQVSDDLTAFMLAKTPEAQAEIGKRIQERDKNLSHRGDLKVVSG